MSAKIDPRIPAEAVGIADVYTLVEFTRERRGRLVIGSEFDGEYRVELDVPGGFSVSDRNLGDTIRWAVESMKRYPNGLVD